jgi:acyl carrier protein
MAVRVLLAATEHGPSRAQARMSSRRALRLLTTALGTTALGQEASTAGTSLSHAEGLSVAAAVIGTGSTTSIGVDLEENHPADPRTGRYFLQDHELAWLEAAREKEHRRNDEHLRLWTVKEALFKADPGNTGPRTRIGLRSYTLADPGARAGRARRSDQHNVRFGYGSTRLGERHLSVAACLTGMPTQRSAMDTEAFTTEAVRERIAELLAVPVAEVTPPTPVRNLVRESFMLVELVIDLQEEYGTYFTQDELREIETIGQLIDLLRTSPKS